MAQSTAVVMTNAYKARKSGLQFDAVVVFKFLFCLGFNVKVETRV
jgi:hypothetical protein